MSIPLRQSPPFDIPVVRQDQKDTAVGSVTVHFDAAEGFGRLKSALSIISAIYKNYEVRSDPSFKILS